MLINVRVQPRAGKRRIERLADDSFKVWLRAAPEGGKANEELVEAIAEFFKVRKSSVRIVAGVKSRDKRVEVTI